MGHRKWVVLLEAVRTADAPTLAAETANRLLRAMGGEGAGGLHCPDRVAVQIEVSGADIAAALAAVLLRWRAAARRVGLQDWDLVRAEVLTPNEFEQDCGFGPGQAGGTTEPPAWPEIAAQALRTRKAES